ncbi:MAG: hybrid sensor histidine kinase/response regulator [Phycisphaerales bacterium]|nr:hybrid sensor histidine kinase/response regulator [Phycisphaerales bacterium]
MIVIAEDHSDTLRVLTLLLSREGYTVRGAGDAPAALALAREALPKLFILDHDMPGMTGIEALQQIRADPQLMLIPVVFYTAAYDHDLMNRAKMMGATDWLIKGVHNMHHLLRAVANAIA